MTSCARDRGRPGTPAHPLPRQRAEEEHRRHGLSGDVRDGRAGEAEPGRVHEQGAEDDADQAARQHVADRPAQLLHPAQPAVPGEGDQEQRHPEGGDAQPLLPR